MTLLNVSFGIFAFLPQGWLFMAFIIICECLLISKSLTTKWTNKRIFWTVTGSNITSGLVGMITSILLNGGWFLVVWFPWVSNHEINLKNEGSLEALIIYYLIAFIVSIIIEIFINLKFLKKQYLDNKVIWITIAANVTTYLIGTLILYSYSFGGI